MARPNTFRKRRRKVCYFTENNIKYIDYKDADLLRRFISDRGKILPKRVTGTKAGYQKELSVAIKRARHMALLPFVKE
jgi:small subunit ribosomal protein S18